MDEVMRMVKEKYLPLLLFQVFAFIAHQCLPVYFILTFNTLTQISPYFFASFFLSLSLSLPLSLFYAHHLSFSLSLYSLYLTFAHP